LAEISTKGGTLRKWELKKFNTWDKHPVQLVDYTQNGDFTVLLTTTDGRVINTKDLYFDVQASSNNIKIEGNFEFEIIFTLPASNGGRLVKKMKFRNEEYGFETEIQLLDLGSVIATISMKLHGNMAYVMQNKTALTNLVLQQHMHIRETNSPKSMLLRLIKKFKKNSLVP